MKKITELGEVIGATISDKDEIARHIGDVGNVIFRMDFYSDNPLIDDTYFKLSKRDIGSSFVIGHDVWGKIGSELSPQPYLGDSRGAAVTLIEQSGATAP